MLGPTGPYYGMLSNQLVHVGMLHRNVNAIEPYGPDDDALSINLMHVRVSYWLVLVVSELAFAPWLKNLHYCKPHEDGWIYSPDDTEAEWMRDLLFSDDNALE